MPDGGFNNIPRQVQGGELRSLDIANSFDLNLVLKSPGNKVEQGQRSMLPRDIIEVGGLDSPHTGLTPARNHRGPSVDTIRAIA